MTPDTPTKPQDLTAMSLLNGAVDLLRAHPMTLVLPILIVSLLRTGGGGYGSGAFYPWWAFYPFFFAIAVVILLIGLALAIAAFLVWIVTFEASMEALDAPKSEPSLKAAWSATKEHLRNFGASIQRAWDRTDGHRGDLLFAALIVFVVDFVASAILGFIPILGSPIRGVIGALAAAIWAATLAVYYHRSRGASRASRSATPA